MANVNHRGKRQSQRQYAQVLIPVEPVQQGSSHNGESCPLNFLLLLRVLGIDKTLTGDSRRYVLRIVLPELLSLQAVRCWIIGKVIYSPYCNF